MTLRFLAPAPEPRDGQSAITVDLSGFALLAGRVGRDAALLYLLLRAIRRRAATGQATLHALSWPLRAAEGRVRRWLTRLADADLVTYADERTPTGDRIVFEFPAQTPLRAPERLWPPATRVHVLPTIWFVQALPLLGRDAFALYLALLGHEPLRAPTVDVRLAAVAQTIGITGVARRRRAVRRLVRAGVLALDGARGTLREPPPPTPRERRLLRFLAIPFLPAALRELAALAVALALATAAILTLGLHASRHR